MHRSR